MVSGLLLLVIVPAVAQSIGGHVTDVRDGDTIEVDTGAETRAVRLHGIDTPESDQPFGERAARFTSQRVLGTRVTVEVVDEDRYGRLVGRVYLPDGSELNELLVAYGFAWWYRRYAPDDAELEQLQQEARGAGRGLWSRSNPIPPWDWRDGARARGGHGSAHRNGADSGTSGGIADGAAAGGPDRDCSDFDTQAEAQAFFEQAGGPARDPHRLDGDGDGKACESLP